MRQSITTNHQVGKKVALAAIDMALLGAAFFLAMGFRFDFNIPPQYPDILVRYLLPFEAIFIIFLYLFKLYDSLWELASLDEFLLATGGCVTGGIGILIFDLLVGAPVPKSIVVLAMIFATIEVVGFRIVFRVIRRFLSLTNIKGAEPSARVMIVGAGSAASIVIREMKQSNYAKNLVPVCLVDDDPRKKGQRVLGIKVEGGTDDIPELARRHAVDQIMIAIPSLAGERKAAIIENCRKTKCGIKIVPGVYELLGDRFILSQMRDINMEDLLGRDSVKLETAGISRYLTGKVVLISGGGGSIGSELARQIACFKPARLILLDVYENTTYEIQNELRRNYPNLDLAVRIASIRDRNSLDHIFAEEKPQVVFHAAAHKHVPLMEDNPIEAISNNVFGTLNLAETADRYHVEKFVMISTDKAVNPTNVMGASKRMCEMIVQAIAQGSETKFGAVRFGNVLGSNGSVIPLFQKQIAAGGPVTVTHPDITRYFMTIPEATQLVLQAGAFAERGEIFILDMGKPVKICELAKNLIQLSGYTPDVDIKIEFTGLRPGEKLYEEVLMAEEGNRKTAHDKIFIAAPGEYDFDRLKHELLALDALCESGNAAAVIEKVRQMVPTYKCSETAHDEMTIAK